jgi:pyruvate ferredoxin oxidoreductase delta subunit
MSKQQGWDEFEIGAMLRSFDGKIDECSAFTPQRDRNYSQNNSHVASVADWRLIKPVYNKDYCIDCQFCWIYCPDVSIISRDKKMIGIDMDHCKGCGICVEVCPTNPKSLLMFPEQADEETEIASWPTKDEEEE